MKILILAIGKCRRGSPEETLISEYQKRCKWKVEIREHDNASQEEEAAFLQSHIPASAKVIVLDEHGQNFSSVELAQKIENWKNHGDSTFCFLIGGADGHLPATLARADLVLSFGRQTFPHMLMRAVLAEQIYRIESIISNHPYHRE